MTLNPAVPAGAYDEFLVEALPRAKAQRAWTPADGPLPTLYPSHGAPPLYKRSFETVEPVATPSGK